MLSKGTINKNKKLFLILGVTLGLFLLFYGVSYSVEFLMLKDTISTSNPGVSADHRIEFQPRLAVPASGKIIITPETGAFSIPSTLDYEDMDFSVNNTQRFLAASADATFDGVSVISGSSGKIEITLNSASGISASDSVEILIGQSTSFQSTTADAGIINPSLAGYYDMNLETRDDFDAVLDKGNTEIAIINPINVSADTTDTTPPLRFNGLPSGELPQGTTNVEISLETNELARCRYDTVTGTDFDSMPFVITDTYEQTLHSTEVTTEDGQTYEFYIRCDNPQGLANDDDFLITFSIEETPDPGSEPGEEGGTDVPTTGGTGSGSGEAYPPETASFNFSGRAFPGGTAFLLIDGEIKTQVSTTANGGFSIAIADITKGVYTFTLYAEDADGIKSSNNSITLTVRPNTHTTIGGIFLSPTITAAPNPADPGDEVVFSGSAFPNSEILLRLNRKGASGAGSIENYNTTADSSGIWTYNLDTTGMQVDTYQAQALASFGGEESDFSPRIDVGLGVELEEGECGTADLNCDGSVNLTDFSILLFWWNTDGGTSDPSADINGDGTVNLPDFSIMLFHWTG